MQIVSQLGGNRIAGALWWLFAIAVIVTPRVTNLDVFYARDELAIWSWSDQFTQAVWHGDLAGTLTTSDYPGIPMFWAQTAFLTFKYRFPPLFPNTMLPLGQISHDRSLPLLAERRLAAGLLVSLQLLAAVWLTRRLWGNRAALLAAVLLGLDPFSLSEARLLRLEMVSAGFVILSVLAFLLYRQTRLRRWVLISGAMAGLAVSSKTSAGLLVPYIWLLLLLDLWPGLRIPNLQSPISNPQFPIPNPLPAIITGLLWAGGAITAFWLIWPAMWVAPLAALEHLWQTGFAQAANRSVWGDVVFFWGQTIEGGDPGPWFYPVALAFRTTPLVWLGVILALVSLLFPSFPHPVTPSPRRVVSPAFLLLFAGVLLLELSFIISKVDRFMLIFFPALSILTAVQFSRFNFQFNIQHLYPQGYSTFNIQHFILPAVLVLQLTQIIPAHPYYFTYWDPLAGGGRAAMNLLPVGAGEGIDLAMEYLNRLPNAERLSVVCGGSKPWCEGVFKGTTLRFATYASGEWFSADYATFYISHLQRGRYPDEIVDFFMKREPVYRVEMDGATYVWVFNVPQTARFAGAWNDLAGQARLLGFDLGASTQPAGSGINAEVWWQNMGAGVDRLVVRLVDQSGYEWIRVPVSPLPEYAGITQEQAAVVAGQAEIVLPPAMPPGSYFWRIGVVDEDKTWLAGEFPLPDNSGALTVVPGPPLTDPARLDIAVRLDAPLAPEVMLLGYTPPAQVINTKSPVWLTLYWQAVGNPADYHVLLQLVDAQGQEAARWQGRPGYGAYPMSRWSPGQIVQDVWPLQVDPQTPPGEYSLLISLDGPNLQFPNPKSLIPNLHVWPRPLSFDIPDMQAEVNARFGNRLTLLGYDLYFDTGGNAAGALFPTFYWQSQTDFEAMFDLRLMLRDADTDVVLKTWRVPLGSNGARRIWQAGEVLAASYRLELDALPRGRYHLDIALLPVGGTEPVPAELADGRESAFVRIDDVQDKIVVRVKR